MTLTRDAVIETLAVLAGPLGPPIEPMANLDYRQKFQERWIDAGGVELFEVLVGLIASPPPFEQVPIHPDYADDWTTLITEIAGILGKRHPELARQRLLPLLDNERARPAVLEVLASAGLRPATP
jgi:hypothetical protein